jgi:hypothetical protein
MKAANKTRAKQQGNNLTVSISKFSTHPVSRQAMGYIWNVSVMLLNKLKKMSVRAHAYAVKRVTVRGISEL